MSPADRELFREHVLRAVQEPYGERGVRRIRYIERHVRSMGWDESNLGGRSLKRAVDRALQYHRKAGRIGYDRVFGWYVRER